METLILIVTVLVCSFVVLLIVGMLLTRADTLSNLTPSCRLKSHSPKKVAILKMYLRNSGLKRNAEKYIEREGDDILIPMSKDEFVRKLTSSRTLKFQINCLIVCLAALLLTKSLILTSALFLFYLACALNDPLYVRVLTQNTELLSDD